MTIPSDVIPLLSKNAAKLVGEEGDRATKLVGEEGSDEGAEQGGDQKEGEASGNKHYCLYYDNRVKLT